MYLGSNIGFTANDEFMILRVECSINSNNEIKVALKPELSELKRKDIHQNVSQSLFLKNDEINLNLLKYDGGLLEKIKDNSCSLESVCHVKDGIVPFIREKLVSSEKNDARYVRFAGIAGKYVLQKYHFISDELYLCYDINEAKKHISDPVELRKVQLRDKSIFLSRKIITAQNSATLKGTIDEDQIFVSNSIHSTYIRDEYKERISLEVILALLNSHLMNFYHNSLRVKATDLHPQILVSNLKKLPIKIPTESDQAAIASLVEQILAAKKTDAGADVSTLEAEINARVYGLYGLSADEIAIIEGG